MVAAGILARSWSWVRVRRLRLRLAGQYNRPAGHTMRIYLDNAATSWPKPPQVGEAMVRFLAEDVGKRLDHVLDAVLRALVRQNGSSGR